MGFGVAGQCSGNRCLAPLDGVDPPSWPPRRSRSSELEERPGHGSDPRFMCPTGSHSPLLPGRPRSVPTEFGERTERQELRTTSRVCVVVQYIPHGKVVNKYHATTASTARMMNATRIPNSPVLLQASSRLKALISAVPSRRKPRRMPLRSLGPGPVSPVTLSPPPTTRTVSRAAPLVDQGYS